jgi:hypothetical protein
MNESKEKSNKGRLSKAKQTTTTNTTNNKQQATTTPTLRLDSYSILFPFRLPTYLLYLHRERKKKERREKSKRYIKERRLNSTETETYSRTNK